MSKVVIEFSTDNDYFQNCVTGYEGAVESTLHKIAERIGWGDKSGIVMDGYGNRVGTFEVID